ncbi:MAG: hypothetical protein ACREOW_11705 [Thermodesulfobacteriota bacterium]
MKSVSKSNLNLESLFNSLYFAQTEEGIDKLIIKHPQIFKQENWYPLGGNENTFAVIENQKSSSIDALIEKITNSIDAILMKKCYEVGIDPKSAEAPRAMEEAVSKFFPDHKNWDLPAFRKKQAESIQIVADGPRMNTSLIIYDDGEGQHPKDFEGTFLSLLTGNKNEIHFVQGKYNMGGSGAIVFCGKKRYQLIASRKYDNSGKFGFTLVRKHPLSKEDEKTRKNTWYEYLKIDGQIPAFETDSLELGLYNRLFTTGTIIKLYSYDLPAGSRSVISRDLNQSINEYLFEPALPVITVDKKERYPDDRNLERELHGLKRRLEQDESKYIDDYFSYDFTDFFGKMKVTCYVFKTRVDGKSVKDSKDAIRREFFKNNMSVLFSVNGQAHGHYTSEFITRSLKLNLLKNHLLIHVDCTNMDYNFRTELFMASRDRLKDGEETRALRSFLAKKLGDTKGRLSEIEKRRKDSINVDSENTKELLKSFTKNLPINSELMKLLGQTFKLEQKKDGPKKEEKERGGKKEEKEPFIPQRFPSYFKLRLSGDGDKRVVKVPLGGEKTIRFETDVENYYFDRIEEPGELRIALLDFKSNESTGGNAPGKIDRVEDVFNVNRSSPHEGTIKVMLNPKDEVNVGDAAKIKVTLNGSGNEFEEIFWVKISEPEAPKEKSKKDEKKDEQNLGLPECVLAFREGKENSVTWERVEEATTETMGYETVMYPMVNGDTLEKIYINMDSNILKNFKSKYKNPDENQLELADRKYISSVYFHTLFLYTITKNRKYKIYQEKEGAETDVDVGAYLKDLFESYYSEFILNFGGAEEMMQGLGD